MAPGLVRTGDWWERSDVDPSLASPSGSERTTSGTCSTHTGRSAGGWPGAALLLEKRRAGAWTWGEEDSREHREEELRG